jgi:BirA family transcriptional regulator, biotin operon repressor / biotin---[acetyl-CoA-carboxylase] ligase
VWWSASSSSPLRSAADVSGERSLGPYDGYTGDELARILGLPRVVAFLEVGSTLDVAHGFAADGAPAGTLILADAQTSGRGRMGRRWLSEAGAGIWMTLIERPRDVAALEVLSLRVGLSLAPVLDAFTASPVQLKWPNDLYVGARKLGGILVEARWRDSAPEWVAVGVGINIRAPASESRAVGLEAIVSRVEVLSRLVPAMRAAAGRTGSLDRAELDAFAARDAVVGRRCREPIAGVIRGVEPSGALLIDVGSEIVVLRVGSLVLEEEEL